MKTLGRTVKGVAAFAIAACVYQTWASPDNPNNLGKAFFWATNFKDKNAGWDSYTDFEFKRYSANDELYKKTLNRYYGTSLNASPTEVKDALLGTTVVTPAKNHTYAALFLTFSNKYYGEKIWLAGDLKEKAYQEWYQKAQATIDENKKRQPPSIEEQTQALKAERELNYVRAMNSKHPVPMLDLSGKAPAASEPR